MPTTGLDYRWVEHFLYKTTKLRVNKDQASGIESHAERKLRDTFDIAEETALAHGREVMHWHDLPLIKGFRATLHEYAAYSTDLSSLEIETRLPAIGMITASDVQVHAALPRLFGALVLIIDRVISILTPSSLSPTERLAMLTRTEEDRPNPEELSRAKRIIDVTMERSNLGGMPSTTADARA